MISPSLCFGASHLHKTSNIRHCCLQLLALENMLNMTDRDLPISPVEKLARLIRKCHVILVLAGRALQHGQDAEADSSKGVA